MLFRSDVLALEDRDLGGRDHESSAGGTSINGGSLLVSELMREAVLVPSSLPLPAVLDRLTEAGEELACVLDEYGGLAGVITVEDVAEELVGEITDEHDAEGSDQARRSDGGWVVPGTRHVDDVGRLIGADLPEGDYQTVGGLVIARLQRMADVGDSVEVRVPADAAEEDEPDRTLRITVQDIDRRVPGTVRLDWAEPVATGHDDDGEAHA